MAGKQKITREQKKEIKAVIQKWVPEKILHNFFPKVGGAIAGGSAAIGGTLGLALGSMVDLMFTGGLGTIALTCAGMMGFAAGAPFTRVMFIKGVDWKNTAGQKVNSNLTTAVTLMRMEQKLSKLFNAKAKAVNTAQEIKVQRQIDAVHTEADIIKPMYEIVSSGLQTKNALTFEFVKVQIKDSKAGSDLEKISSLVPKEFRQKPKKLGK